MINYAIKVVQQHLASGIRVGIENRDSIPRIPIPILIVRIEESAQESRNRGWFKGFFFFLKMEVYPSEEVNEQLHVLLGYPSSSSIGIPFPEATVESLRDASIIVNRFIATNQDKAIDVEHWLDYIHKHPLYVTDELFPNDSLSGLGSSTSSAIKPKSFVHQYAKKDGEYFVRVKNI